MFPVNRFASKCSNLKFIKFLMERGIVPVILKFEPKSISRRFVISVRKSGKGCEISLLCKIKLVRFERFRRFGKKVILFRGKYSVFRLIKFAKVSGIGPNIPHSTHLKVKRADSDPSSGISGAQTNFRLI